MSDTSFSPQERRAITTLGSVYALRMGGLFIILPIFALHAETLTGFTPMLAGISVGIYGLTQALLQIPVGWLSDHYGRRPAVLVGLGIFAIGSVIAGMSDTIYGMIVGRAVQGAGAVSAVLTAWVADLSREEVRAKAMGIIGMTIGGSFLLSLMAGPVLASILGAQGVFFLVAGLIILATLMVLRNLPAGMTGPARHANILVELPQVLRDKRLLRMDLSIGISRMVLTANFMTIPFFLRDLAGLPIEDHSLFYVAVLLSSTLFLFPTLRMVRQRDRVQPWLWRMLLALAVCEVLLFLVRGDVILLGSVLLLFFIAFNFLEAQLPSQISLLCPAGLRGASLGVFTSCQFLGAFFGGLATGLFLQANMEFGLYLFLAASAAVAAWLQCGVKS